MLATGIFLGLILIAIAFLVCFLVALFRDQAGHSWHLAREQARLAAMESVEIAGLTVPKVPASRRHRIRVAWELASVSSASRTRGKENFSCEISSSF
jgi:hypothetical protein